MKQHAKHGKQAVVSIAAGASQLPLIRAARDLGYEVVGVDRDPEAAGLAHCALRVECSTRDADAVVRELDALRERVELCAVLTQSSGAPVVTAARAAEHLGLLGLGVRVARASASKPAMLELAREAGLVVPERIAVRRLEEWRGAPPLPLVLKPACAQGGKHGVGLARSAHEIAARFAAARAASDDGVVEIEELVAGDDVVACVFFDGAGARTALFLDEDSGFDARGLAGARGISVPSARASAQDRARIEAAASALASACDVGTGVGFLTFRVRPVGPPVLIEVHFDLGGDSIAAALLPLALGRPWIPDVVRWMAAEPCPDPRYDPLPTALRFVCARDADRCERLLEIETLPGVRELAIDGGTDAPGWARVGYVAVQAPSLDALRERVRAVDAALASPFQESPLSLYS